MDSKTFSSGSLSDADAFDPFDMDREEFNPHLCLIRYTQECNLQNLLSRKNHIDREIRCFSSDLQNHLYENYEKFINATSVVSNMKTDFYKMEREIDNLHDKMNIVQKTSSAILQNLRPTEGKISKLLKSQDIMKKLVLLTDLVPTLKLFVDSGAYNSAARHYLKAEHVLNKYRHFTSLGGIVKDTTEIVGEIRYALRNKLNCNIYGKEELSDTLKLLLSLGEKPACLLERFLDCSSKCLLDLMASMHESLPKQSEGSSEEIVVNEIMNYINFCCNYTDKVSKVIDIGRKVFLPVNELNEEQRANKLLEEFFTGSMNHLSIKLVFYIKEKFQNIDDDFLSHNLDKFFRHCHISGIFTQTINFYQKGMDIILKVCVSRCEFLLENLKDDFKNHLISRRSQLSAHVNVRNFLMFLKEWTEQKLMEVLQALVVYIRPEFRCCREVVFRRIFSKVIVREGIFVAFFRYVIDETRNLLSSSKLQQPNEILFCILLSKYLLDLKQKTVSEFLSKVDDYLCFASENLGLTKAEDIATEFTDAAEKIIELYIQVRYQNMANMIQISMENKNWVELNEPIRPRAVVKMLLKDIQEAKEETEKIFYACQNLPRKRGSDLGGTILLTTHSSDLVSEPRSIEERVLLNKILAENSELSNKVEPNTPSILNCLIRKVLKSFIECVRLKTFNRFGLQQIQIDVYYMQSHIHNLLDFNINTQSFFDEILSSTYNRTINPKLMNKEVVSFICSNTV